MIGKFISQDPLFWNFDQSWLADPQNQNSYSYARNNPIILSDPSGLLSAYFPGTWTSQNDMNNKGFQNFINDVKSTFQQQGSGNNFWMPSQELRDNNASRQSVVKEFANYMSTYKFAEGETFNVVGWSHGGNVANMITQTSDRKIDNLVTLGTPVRYDYMPNHENIANHYNAYSNLDAVQVIGGTVPTSVFAGAVAGGLAGSLFGPAGTLLGAATGFVIGQKLGWGEAGPATRTYSGAVNVNVTGQTSLWPIKSHTSMPNSSVWSQIDNKINKK